MKRDLIDVNIHLGHWPTRRIDGDETGDMVRVLKSHDVAQAWAGSFEGLLHKDIASVNERLADDCRRHGRNILRPMGSVNPKLPDWEDDVRRCAEEHGMHGIRLHPNYHGYTLDDPVFPRLLRLAADRNLVVQLVVTMEDERMMHPRLRVPHVDVSPLLVAVPDAPVELILLNAFRAVRGDLLERLVVETNVFFDIAWIEGIAGIERVLRTVPAERLLFGSHAPLFYYESALLKMDESALTPEVLDAIRFENAQGLGVAG